MNKFTLTINKEEITNEIYGSAHKAEKFLLFCHGFPGTNRLGKIVTVLEKEPVAIIKINYRGDRKSGGKFSFLGSLDDIKNTAIYLRHKYDCKKLYVLGYSMGGFYAVNILKNEPSLFDKAILLNTVVNTQALFSNKSLMDKLWTSAEKILSLESPEFYEQEIKTINEKFNPMYFTHTIKTPIDVIQSAKDDVISLKDVKKFYSLLNCKKNYFEIPEADHDSFGNEEQLIKAICS